MTILGLEFRNWNTVKGPQEAQVTFKQYATNSLLKQDCFTITSASENLINFIRLTFL